MNCFKSKLKEDGKEASENLETLIEKEDEPSKLDGVEDMPGKLPGELFLNNIDDVKDLNDAEKANANVVECETEMDINNAI